jgi:hypothetical protein
MEILCCSINECLLVIRLVFKVDREDRFVVHVNDCGPTEHAKSVSMAKSELDTSTHSKPRETAWSISQALSRLRRTPDRMVVT